MPRSACSPRYGSATPRRRADQRDAGRGMRPGRCGPGDAGRARPRRVIDVEPGRQRVQPDGGHAARIRHGRPRAPAGRRRHRDRGAHQHLSLRRRQMAVHRRQLRPDLRPADDGDRPAGAWRRTRAYATNGDRCARRDELDAVDRRLDRDAARPSRPRRCWRPRTCPARACTTSPTAPPTRISAPAPACNRSTIR